MKEILALFIVAFLDFAVAENHFVYITQIRTGNFHGHFTLPRSHVEHEWRAYLKFSNPVDKIEVLTSDVISSSIDHTEYILTNQATTKDIPDHGELRVEFYGHAPGTRAPTATVSIQGGRPVNSSTVSRVSRESKMKHDYGKAMSLSILFYDAQRSGHLPSNNPIQWRSNSAVHDNGNGHDLSGGWYDAGDHVKFNLPMAWSTHVLSWGFEKFKDAYQHAGQLNKMYNMLKWPLDYFLKCWEPSKHIYWVQVGDGHLDHQYWGRPEDMHMNRPAFKISAGAPGSDVAGTTVAALASGYLVFKNKDAQYAAKLLANAKSLYAFAKAHPGIYSDSVSQAREFYRSSGWKDNMCEAAAELYKATKDSKYLNDAKGWFNSGTPWGYSWDDQNAGCQLLLWEATHDAKYKTAVEAFVKSYMPGGSVPYTPCGLVWRDKWGSNRYAANAAFIAAMAANDGIGGDSYKKWVMSQMNYLLGNNRLHMSYEIGFGHNYPKRPHHRGASCTASGCVSENQDSPHVLKGALVGGPGQNDDYQDRRSDYVKNEVACDYNAGFQSANAGLYHFAVHNRLPASPASKC